MPHVNKTPLVGKGNLLQTKTRPRMNYEWIGKTITKKKRSKNFKKVKIKVKLPHVNKKSPARKQIFVQTPFSQYTLKKE